MPTFSEIFGATAAPKRTMSFGEIFSSAPLSVPFVNQPTHTDPLTELLKGGPSDPDWMLNPPAAPPVQGIPSVQGVLDNYNLSGYVDPDLKNPPSFELPKSALTPPGIRQFNERQQAEKRRRDEEERAATEAAFAPGEPADVEGQYAKMQRRAKYYETLPYKITADIQSDPETFERYRRLNELATGGPLLDVPAENRAAAQEAISETLASMEANGVDDPVRWMMEIDSFEGPQGLVGRNLSAAWEQTKRSGANMFDALVDPLGNNTLGTRQRQMEAGWQEGVEDVKDERSLLPNAVNEVARAASQSAPQLAAAAGVGYATKNPALAWATLLGPSGVENFQVGRTNGLTNAEAAGRAVALAGVEYATAKVGGKVAEKFGMKTFEELAFGTGAKAAATGTLKPITRAIGGSVIEGGEEVAAGVAQQFSDFVVGLQDELVGDETPEQLALAFAVGMVASGAMHLPTFANFVQNPTVENAEAAGVTEEIAPTQEARASLATAAAGKMETMAAGPVVDDAQFEMQPETETVAPEPIQSDTPAPKKSIGRRKTELAEQPLIPTEPPLRKPRLGERITTTPESQPPIQSTPPVTAKPLTRMEQKARENLLKENELIRQGKKRDIPGATDGQAWVKNTWRARRPEGVNTPAEAAKWIEEGGYGIAPYWKYIQREGITLEEAFAREAAPTPPVAPPDVPPVAPSQAPADSGVAKEVVAPTVVEAPKKKLGQKPEERPAIFTQETRGKGQQYHGTSATTLSPTNDHYSTLNYYGQGFYTTDAMDVAYGYSKRGAKQSGKRGVWRIEEKRPLNIYNAEQPISPEVRAMLEDVAESQVDLGDSLDQKPATLRELYDDFRDHSKDNGLSADTVQETFDTLAYRLQQMGYDGIQHQGGLRTGTKTHTVKIYFNPEQDIAVSEVVPAEPVPLPTAEEAERATGKKRLAQKKAQPASTQDTSPPPLPEQSTSSTEDFNLSGEGSTDPTPIVEPYQPERIPPKRKTQRQPQLEGLPEDLDESVLAGQQGLFSASTGEQLQPSTPKVIVTPPKSQREIITALSKSLDIPIRFGRMQNRLAGGVFFRKPNLIASKKANDIPVVTHEVGHKLDAMFKLSSDKSIRSELDRLGDPATPNSRSSWTKSKTKAYKLGEGMAEFVRYWMTDPKKAKAEAPQTHAAFEAVLDANKDLGDSMRQAQEDIRLWRTAQPQARLRSQISIGDNPNKTRYTLSQLTRDVVDDLHYLRLATEDAKLGEPGLKPSQNPYLLARNLRGSYGMAATFIQNGTVDFNSKDVVLGTSLEDALKPVGGRINDFRDWIVAKRAQELESQGRQTGLVKSDIDAVADKFAGEPEFEKAFADLKKWNDAVLQYAVDAGLVTPDSAATIREMNQDYVPFHRLFEVGASEAPSNESTGKGSGLNPGKPGSLKRLKGSTRDIVDPLETMVKNAYAIITASEKSAISLAVADMANLPNMGKWVERVAPPMQAKSVRVDEIIDQLADLGADVSNLEKSAEALTFFRQAKKPPRGENTISVIRDGKPEFYRLNRYLHDTFEALDLDDAGKLVRILSAPAQILRAGVTLEPGFNLANAMRDTFGAAVIGKYGALPFETTLRGLGALINKPQLVAEWAASGGRSSVEANYFDRKKMQQYLAERISKDLTPAERALIVATKPLKALRWMATTFEEATRIGEYEKAYDSLKKSGMADGEARRLAAFEARDRQDFAKGGAKTKILRHVAAFWNAQLQANVRLAQAFKERPVQTIAKGLAFVTLPKLLEQAINWDDEDYWQRPQWERDAFYMIPIGSDDAGHTRFLRIPTPFEIGIIFGTIPGRFLQWAKTNDPDAVKDLPGFLLKQTVPVPNPSGAVTVAELIPDQGYSYFRGREIVPDSEADKPKDLQWTEQTSTLAKKIGQALGVSPMKVDYLIESTTGGLGKVALGKQVPGERFVTDPLANVGQAITDFYEIRRQLTEDAERIKATGEHKGFGPVMLAEFEKASASISALRSRSRNSDDPAKRAKLDDEAYQIAVEMMKRYRDNPEPEDAVKAYGERQAKRAILSNGRPHRRKKKIGSKQPMESEPDYLERLEEWEIKRDASLNWLRAHKDSPVVQAAIADAAKDIPAFPEFKPNASGVDFNYRRQVNEWKSRYGKAAQLVESLK